MCLTDKVVRKMSEAGGGATLDLVHQLAYYGCADMCGGPMLCSLFIGWSVSFSAARQHQNRLEPDLLQIAQ